MPPLYDWSCIPCNCCWTVSARVADRDEPSRCPKCDGIGERQITLPNIDKVAAGGWNQQSYNPGLGCWTKSWKHGREIAKSRGLEEIGTTATDTIHKESTARQKQIRDDRWAEASRDKMYD